MHCWRQPSRPASRRDAQKPLFQFSIGNISLSDSLGGRNAYIPATHPGQHAASNTVLHSTRSPRRRPTCGRPQRRVVRARRQPRANLRIHRQAHPIHPHIQPRGRRGSGNRNHLAHQGLHLGKAIKPTLDAPNMGLPVALASSIALCVACVLLAMANGMNALRADSRYLGGTMLRYIILAALFLWGFVAATILGSIWLIKVYT